MDQTKQSADEIFFAALERTTANERSDFLDAACAHDSELRQRIERLLGAQPLVTSFLESPAPGMTAGRSGAWSISEQPAEKIGPYNLLQQIGEGGFGVVFLAEQERPVRRRVAVKIIKPGMDTREVIARFEAERQALAMMDHPNIAKVHDAGATENGRPYFVMELVQGVPITEYCDRCNLTTRERLELFVVVCQAVQHAHQKGVIHRDIKPTNVLVAIQDGRPAPKIIDFGVAKAINQRLTERTLLTAFAQIVGTPLYMSPEQAELSPLGVDTRSDIYSLGVLLYELLTGNTPFDKDRLHSVHFDELRRIIREEEPPRPSARISTMSANLATTVAESRRTEPRRLQQSVRGDLDWIVMKCLDKDRSRRYETANSLELDPERYLANEAVLACPPSAGYRLRKFARRNKTALIAGSVFAAALVLGLVGTTWQAIRATHAERLILVQRDRALVAESLAKGESERASQEAVKAKTEAAIAQTVNDFLNQDLLGQADPQEIPYDRYKEPKADLKLLTVLDRAADKLEDRFADQPLVEAALRHTIGLTYINLDNDSRSALHLQRAVELREAHLGEEHPDTLRSMDYLALANYDPDLAARVLEIRRRVLGKDNLETLRSKFALALVTRIKGEKSGDKHELARVIALFREALESQRRVLGDDHPASAWTMHSLAHTLVNYAGKDGIPAADDREIESLYRHALSIFRNLRGDNWQTYDITLRLGQFLSSRHRYEEAEALLQDGVLRLKSLPAAPMEIAAGLNWELDNLYRSWDKPARAAEWERRLSANESETKEPQVESN